MISEVNDFIKKKRDQSLFLGIIIFMIFLIINSINIPVFLRIVIILAILLLYYLCKLANDMKLIRMFDYILCDNCDSIQYYEICKNLNSKYPKNYTILEAYSVALRYNLSDLKEKVFLLNKYQKYKENLFYLNLQIDVVPESNKKEIFYKFYKKSRLFNEKNSKRIEGIIGTITLKFLI